MGRDLRRPRAGRMLGFISTMKQALENLQQAAAGHRAVDLAVDAASLVLAAATAALFFWLRLP